MIESKAGRFKETVYVGIESVGNRPHQRSRSPSNSGAYVPTLGTPQLELKSTSHIQIGNLRRLRTYHYRSLDMTLAMSLFT